MKIARGSRTTERWHPHPLTPPHNVQSPRTARTPESGDVFLAVIRGAHHCPAHAQTRRIITEGGVQQRDAQPGVGKLLARYLGDRRGARRCRSNHIRVESPAFRVPWDTAPASAPYGTALRDALWSRVARPEWAHLLESDNATRQRSCRVHGGIWRGRSLPWRAEKEFTLDFYLGSAILNLESHHEPLLSKLQTSALQPATEELRVLRGADSGGTSLFSRRDCGAGPSFLGII